MLDKNIVILEGLIGEDCKFGKTQEGKEFFTFSLCINSFLKEMADDTERTHSQAFIRIFCYDKKQLAYLRKVNAHRGQRVYILGRLSSYKTEYKGNAYITTNVICRDISIIQTKAFKEKKTNVEQNNDNNNGETKKETLSVVTD